MCFITFFLRANKEAIKIWSCTCCLCFVRYFGNCILWLTFVLIYTWWPDVIPNPVTLPPILLSCLSCSLSLTDTHTHTHTLRHTDKTLQDGLCAAKVHSHSHDKAKNRQQTMTLRLHLNTRLLDAILTRDRAQNNWEMSHHTDCDLKRRTESTICALTVVVNCGRALNINGFS